jgi:hypothetical protein
MLGRMTETTAAAAEATASVNGTAPPPEAEPPCEDCVTTGEKGLAVLAILFGVFVIVMGFDMFSGGKVTGYVKSRADE